MLNSFDFVTMPQLTDGDVKKEKLLLPAGSHTEVAKQLEVPELSGELERAIWQVEQSFLKAEQEQGKETGKQAQQVAADEGNEKRK